MKEPIDRWVDLDDLKQLVVKKSHPGELNFLEENKTGIMNL
jgi:hypothetical protein